VLPDRLPPSRGGSLAIGVEVGYDFRGRAQRGVQESDRARRRREARARESSWV